MIDHLRVYLEQIKVKEGAMVFSADYLGFDAVATTRPIKVVCPFAEERSPMSVPLELEQLRVLLHLGQGHRRQGDAGIVIELMPRRHTSIHIQIGGGGAVAAMRLGPNPSARLHLRPKLWTLVPALNQASEGVPSAFSTRAAGS